MLAWEQIQKTLDYIEEHIDEEFDIDKLAEMAALSSFYYQRLFKRLVKRTVADYVKQRRLSISLSKLNEDKRILDIALELGFASHEHFSRLFKENFGLTPQEYRKNPITLNRCTKPELLLNYVLVDEGVPIITDGIVLEINRRRVEGEHKYIGFEFEFENGVLSGLGSEPGVDPLAIPWDTLHAAKEKMIGLYFGEEELGAMYMSDNPDHFKYFAGAPQTEKPQNEYKEWRIPEGEYVVCEFEAKDFEALVMDALYKANGYLYSVFLANHNIKTEPFNIERYAKHSPDATGMEIWLKICS